MHINKKEAKYYLITIAVLTIVFGFNDRSDFFEWSYWLKNFLMVFVVVTISFLAKQFVLKTVAKRYGFDYEYIIWKVGRYGFRKESEFRFNRKKVMVPLGIILALFLTLISGGIFYFPVVGTSILNINKLKRTGKKFIEGESIEFAKVYLTGPLTYLLLVLLFFNLQKYFSVNFELFVLINLYLAFYGLLPLPGLEGCEILFNSLPLYIFALAFFAATYILLKSVFILTLIFSAIIALLIVVIYLFKYEP